jgi:hypothetical protein
MLGRSTSFDALWARQKASRIWAAGVTRGNRCSLVMSHTLGAHPESPGEMSWDGISNVTSQFRGRPELKKYYLKADQLAKRLEREWGAPELYMAGRLSEPLLRKRRGIIFFENRWETTADTVKTLGAKVVVGAAEMLGLSTPAERPEIVNTIAGPTVDHIDVWNGERTAGGGENGRDGYSFQTTSAAQYVSLWIIK